MIWRTLHRKEKTMENLRDMAKLYLKQISYNDKNDLENTTQKRKDNGKLPDMAKLYLKQISYNDKNVTSKDMIK
jgi:hypothetical protein